ACWTLQSREQGLRFAQEALEDARARHEAGRASIAEVHQARGQYHLFRAQRLQALNQVQENEDQLRALIGMAEGGVRLVPSDSPVLTPCQPDWMASLQEALAGRPELRQARLEVLTWRAVLWLERLVCALTGMERSEAQPGAWSLERAVETLRDQE